MLSGHHVKSGRCNWWQERLQEGIMASVEGCILEREEESPSEAV